MNIDIVLLGALALALIEVVKIGFAGKLPTRFIPLIAIGVGILMSLALTYKYLPIVEILITGLTIGLVSCGLFDQKKILGK